jgi:HEPN domain-containing protein
MKDKIDLVKMWIRKAESDLKTSIHSLKIKPDPPFDTICFHAQQCAEKYLKAYLTYHEIEF